MPHDWPVQVTTSGLHTGWQQPSPFDQKLLNKNLNDALITSNREHWSANGLGYGAQSSLYHMPQTAANAIESIAMKKKQSRNKSKHPTVEPWVYLRHDLDNLGQFEKIMSLDGEIFREAPGRKTVRFKQNKRN